MVTDIDEAELQKQMEKLTLENQEVAGDDDISEPEQEEGETAAAAPAAPATTAKE